MPGVDFRAPFHSVQREGYEWRSMVKRIMVSISSLKLKGLDYNSVQERLY